MEENGAVTFLKAFAVLDQARKAGKSDSKRPFLIRELLIEKIWVKSAAEKVLADKTGQKLTKLLFRRAEILHEHEPRTRTFVLFLR